MQCAGDKLSSRERKRRQDVKMSGFAIDSYRQHTQYKGKGQVKKRKSLSFRYFSLGSDLKYEFKFYK